MSTNYKPSDQNGSPVFNGGLGLAITVFVFVALPAMHLLGRLIDEGPKLVEASATIEPPPPPPEDLPPPPDQKDEIEKPEIEEPPPPMTLEQLEMALNPGSGGAMGDYGFGDFNANVSTADDLMIFDLSELDQKPQVTYQVAPQYPYEMQRNKVKGWVDAEWVITSEGRVIRVRVIRSSHREFESPAITALQKSKFKPGRKDGKDVNTRVKQRIVFNP